jgi:hypothetical protein
VCYRLLGPGLLPIGPRLGCGLVTSGLSLAEPLLLARRVKQPSLALLPPYRYRRCLPYTHAVAPSRHCSAQRSRHCTTVASRDVRQIALRCCTWCTPCHGTWSCRGRYRVRLAHHGRRAPQPPALMSVMSRAYRFDLPSLHCRILFITTPSPNLPGRVTLVQFAMSTASPSSPLAA